MKEFEIIQLIESKSLPTRSYRVPEKLMDSLRKAGEKLFEGNAEDSKLLFYFAAYGLMTWSESQAPQSGSHQDILTAGLKKQLEDEEHRKKKEKGTGS